MAEPVVAASTPGIRPEDGLAELLQRGLPASEALGRWLDTVLPSAGDTSQDCVARLEILRGQLYGQGSAATRDDLTVQSGRPENALAAAVGGTWIPVEPTLTSVIGQLREMGTGAAAFVLSSPPLLQRHGRALLKVDGDVFWVETLATSEQRVRPVGDLWIDPTGATRAIVVAPDGHAVPVESAGTSAASTVEAMLDRSRGVAYRGGGREDETRILVHVDRGVPKPERDLRLVADPSLGIDIVTDKHTVLVSRDGRYVSLDEGARLGLDHDDFMNVMIAEVKNFVPMRSLPEEDEAEDRRDRETTLRALREVHAKLNGIRRGHRVGPLTRGVPIVDLFPPDGKRVYDPVYRDHITVLHAPEDVGRMYVQFSFGARPGAITHLMRVAYRGIWLPGDAPPIREHLGDGIRFGEEISRDFAASLVGGPVHGFFRAAVEYIPEVSQIEGALGVAYTQSIALVNYLLKPTSIAKSYAAINVRTSLNALRGALSAPAQKYLKKHDRTIVEKFRYYAKDRFGADLEQTLVNTIDVSLKRHESAITDIPILKNGNSYTVGQYWDNLLASRPRVPLSQKDALGIRTHFTELDAGKVVLEFRQHGKELQNVDEADDFYRELDDHARRADETARRVDGNGQRYGESLTSAIRRLTNGKPHDSTPSARSRFDIVSRVIALADSAYRSNQIILRRAVYEGSGVTNLAAMLALALDRFKSSDAPTAKGDLYAVLQTLIDDVRDKAGESAGAWLDHADDLLLQLQMQSMRIGGVASSRTGGATRGPRPGTSVRRQGGAPVVDPAGTRLPLGAPVAIDAYAPGTPEYVRRTGGTAGMPAVRETAAVPDLDAGAASGKAKEAALPAFVRRLKPGTSSSWISYSVVRTAGDDVRIVLPDGEQIPGEGWYRHGPLFLHPGDRPGAPGRDEADASGWVLYGDTGWIGRLSNAGNLFSGAADQPAGGAESDGLVLPEADAPPTGRFDPETAIEHRVIPAPSGMYLAPVDSGPPIVHLPWEETLVTGSDPMIGRSAFRLGGLPAGIGWAHARWARSWDLRFDTTDTTSLYAAVLAASNDPVSVGGQVLHDADGLRAFVVKSMRDALAKDGRGWPPAEETYRQAVTERVRRAGGELSENLKQQIDDQIAKGEAWKHVVAGFERPGYWDELETALAPVMISEYLKTGLLVLRSDGRLSSYGSGSPLVVAESRGTDGTPRWVGVPSTKVGRALGGLSGGQVRWAADAGMVFVGRRDGSEFFDVLAATHRATGLGEGDPQALRNELVRLMRIDTSLDGSDLWNSIAAEYVDAAVRDAAGDAAAGESARLRLDNGDALQEIIARVSEPGRGGGLIDALLPLLAGHYFGLPVHVLEPSAQPRYGGAGPGATLARLTGGDADLWVGLAPVTAPRALGAGIRPAEVAGGWRADVPARDRPAKSGSAPTGREPAGMIRAQREWAQGHNRQFVEVPAGADAFFSAVLRAAGGVVSGVTDVEALKSLLLEKIDQTVGRDPDLWLAVYTSYAVLWREQRAGEDDARVREARLDQRIDRGRALRDITASIADPDSWPDLAEALAPYFLHQLGLAVRVVEADGVVEQYGRHGRPLYVVRLAGAEDRGRRWAALPRKATRFAVGSPLGAPNRSDPVLVRLGQAIDRRRTERTAAGAPADGTDAVVAWLRTIRESWPAGGADSPVPAPGGRWRPEDVTEMVGRLGRGVMAGAGSPPRGSGDTAGADLSLAYAVGLTSLLFPRERGGIRPAPVSGRTGDTAAPGHASGIRADQWVAASSLREAIGAVPPGGTVLFAGDGRASVVVDTTEGLRLAEFGPESPLAQVGAPSSAVASMNSAGLALVVGQDGQVIPAEALGGHFVSALGWHGDGVFAPTIGPSHPALAAAGVVPAPTESQNAWARRHGRRFVEPRQGDNAFFVAAFKAAGTELTVNGKKIIDALHLRTELAEWFRGRAAEPDGLSKWPLAAAAFRLAAEGRVIEEFLGDDLTKLDRGAVHHQIAEHLRTAAAAGYIEEAIARAGHWEELTRSLAPALFAEGAGVNLTVVGPDGRVHEYKAADESTARHLVLGRTTSRGTGATGWVAVMPRQDAPLVAIHADATIRLTAKVPRGETVVLDSGQQRIADNEELTVLPTEPGANSIFSAVLAAEHGIWLDQDTYADSPGRLRRGMARLLRERPDVLDTEVLERIGQSVGRNLDIEEIITALNDPAARNVDDIARHLIAPYLGVDLRVVEPDGEIHEHGQGRPVTLAPTGSRNARHWAALIPSGQEARHDTPSSGLRGLPGLPALPGIEEPSADMRWDPGHFRRRPVESDEADGPWRSPSFCTEVDGKVACVSVAVVYRHSPL